jgi:hypothetical protein
MSGEFTGRVFCPYCGHENRVSVSRYSVPEITHCDTDEGGCDQYFVMKPTVTIRVEVSGYRIAGLGLTVDRTAPDEDGGAR